jgi:hypothetical protein
MVMWHALNWERRIIIVAVSMVHASTIALFQIGINALAVAVSVPKWKN